MANTFDGAIGIDVGATTSCVAVWQHGRVETIANDQGNYTTPSFVAFTDEKRLVGDAAKGQTARNPTNTVVGVSRLLGRRLNDPIVQSDVKHWPFRVVTRGDEKPMVEVEFKGETRQFAPEEVSSMILTKMKEVAEVYLGAEVKKAVLTVPAYFAECQRLAVQDAAAIAGLEVLRVITDPTAAAIACGVDRSMEQRTVLVFDFGGSTLDVTLLSCDGGLFDIMAAATDAYLGGQDIDNLMVSHFATEFRRKHRADLTQSPRALYRLRTACERSKRNLSTAVQSSVEVDSLFEGIDFEAHICRGRFEELCGDLFRSTLQPVERVLADAKVDKSAVHDVILVGGSARIPKVQQLVSEFFGGKELTKHISPDHVVAVGAATAAFILNGGRTKQTEDLLL